MVSVKVLAKVGVNTSSRPIKGKQMLKKVDVKMPDGEIRIATNDTQLLRYVTQQGGTVSL